MTPDALTWITLGLMVIWLIAVVRLGVALEIHHAWFGIPALSPEVWLWLRIVCAVVLLDDTMQHALQCIIGRAYRSPLHLLAARMGLI